MQWTVFYSWQTDLPNASNRGFIQSALENAAKAIRTDDSINIEPVIDRDTVGVPGSPDIADTILAKIEQSQVFVADVSIINARWKGRKSPNPNVLIELGYALKTLGPDRVILVMNTAYGSPELLPFDLRMKRVITYAMPATAEERTPQRKSLASSLEMGIRAVIEMEPLVLHSRPSLADVAIEGVTKAAPNQVYLVREFMKEAIGRLSMIAPAFPQPSGSVEADELLVQALAQSVPLVSEFGRLAEAIAVLGSREAAFALLKEFYPILEKYRPPLGFSGTYHTAGLDFHKFLGHELYVLLVSLLLREQRWQLISEILDDSILVKNTDYGEARSVTFEYISGYIDSFESRKRRLGSKRKSIHADLLNERHNSGPIAAACPMSQFVSADYLLFVRVEFEWRPWSAYFLVDHLPEFLTAATRHKYAEQLLKPLAVASVADLRELLRARARQVHAMYQTGYWSPSVDDFDYETIGVK